MDGMDSFYVLHGNELCGLSAFADFSCVFKEKGWIGAVRGAWVDLEKDVATSPRCGKFKPHTFQIFFS